MASAITLDDTLLATAVWVEGKVFECRHCLVFQRDAQNFLDRRIASKNFLASIFLNCWCVAPYMIDHRLFGSLIMNELAQLVIDKNQLIDAGTASVASMRARISSVWLVDHCVRI